MRPHESQSLTERWRSKFVYAFRGLAVGVGDQNSFYVHFPVTLAVLALASWLHVSPVEWSILIASISIVFAAELFNSAIEHLARAITRESNDEIRDALDVASGAVLIASVGAALIGLLVLVKPFYERLFGA